MNILIIVDIQNDFLMGSLRVPRGGEVIVPIINMAHEFDLVVATRDWHPGNHMSFKDFGGDWPSHCVQGQPGAALDPRINRIADVIVSKGTKADKEAYSGFQGTPLGLMIEPIRNDVYYDEPVKITVVGLATDYCVLATAADACKVADEVTVILDACRGVAEDTTQKAVEEMKELGIHVI